MMRDTTQQGQLKEFDTSLGRVNSFVCKDEARWIHFGVLKNFRFPETSILEMLCA